VLDSGESSSGYSGVNAMRLISFVWLLSVALVSLTSAQSYQVISVRDGGTIGGAVKWSGAVPRLAEFPITKDPQICDPNSKKTTDLERLIVSPNGGVANTVVYLKNISAGKPFSAASQRQHLDQRSCRYIPHILMVPEKRELSMQSSDATLHTIHMDGAATYNLPFPFPNQVTSRIMSTPGLVTLRCNGGHVWMNAEMFVIPHPYYAVTDESGRFEFTEVPPGTYEIVAWHEGWMLTGKTQTFDVLTEKTVQRPSFSEPRTWEKSVTVSADQSSTINFTISNK
jgi:Polysaccharide lyase family 4, domain II